MDELNPYTAPKVDVLQGGAGTTAPALTWQQMFFSFEGRIRRGQYWGYIFLAWLAFMVPLVGVGAIVGLITGLGEQGPSRGSDTTSVLVGVMAVAWYLPFLWTITALQAKRWHDRDKSAWWILLGLVPIANIWSLVEVGFLPGTPGRNSFGPPPG